MTIDLARLIEAQEHTYGEALSEIKAGPKMGHWMWFIFPQFAGLGLSDVFKFYAIRSTEEAKAYLKHPVLGKRLNEVSRVLLELETDNARLIFGSPDDLKLHSCMTLFAIADEENPDNLFKKVIDKFFRSKYDKNMLHILKEEMI